MLTDGKPIAQDSNDSNHKPHHQEKVNDDNDAIKDHAREQASADAKLNAAEQHSLQERASTSKLWTMTTMTNDKKRSKPKWKNGVAKVVAQA